MVAWAGFRGERRRSGGETVYPFARVAKTKYHRLGGLNRNLFSQFWSPEVQDQGVGRAVHPLKVARGGSVPGLSPSCSS